MAYANAFALAPLLENSFWHTGNIRTSKIDGNCFFYPNYGVCVHDQQLECLLNLRKAERALGSKEDDPYQMIMLGLNFF